MKLTILLMFVVLVGLAQKQDSVYDLGPVYQNLLDQQETLRRQNEEIEKAKQSFIFGYFAGAKKTLTERDSLVFIEPRKLKKLKKK